MMTEMRRAVKKFPMPAVRNTAVKRVTGTAHGAGRTDGSRVSGFAIGNGEGRTASSAMHGKDGRTAAGQ